MDSPSLRSGSLERKIFPTGVIVIDCEISSGKTTIQTRFGFSLIFCLKRCFITAVVHEKNSESKWIVQQIIYNFL